MRERVDAAVPACAYEVEPYVPARGDECGGLAGGTGKDYILLSAAHDADDRGAEALDFEENAVEDLRI